MTLADANFIVSDFQNFATLETVNHPAAVFAISVHAMVLIKIEIGNLQYFIE